MLNAVYFPLFVLGGALLPLTQMLDWLHQIAKVLPSYHFTNSLIDVTVRGHALLDVKMTPSALKAP